MKHAQLTATGEYISAPNRKKASYSSMTAVRAAIVSSAGLSNSMAFDKFQLHEHHSQETDVLH